MDLDDLIDARGVADLIGLTHRNGVYTYRSRHPDFPQPVITHGRCYMWYRPDITRWMRRRGKNSGPDVRTSDEDSAPQAG